MKNPTTVYVVSAVAPMSVFFQKDIADVEAARLTADNTDEAFEVYAVQITTKNGFRKAIREATLASLTEDQKKALGFIKTPRKKRTAVK